VRYGTALAFVIFEKRSSTNLSTAFTGFETATARLPADLRGVRMRSHRPARGFTLIELLIVVVIIGILAAIAIPKFSNTKGKAQITAMKSDLRNLSSAEENYFYYNEQYTSALGNMNVTLSNGVNLTIGEATGAGWSATATHPQAVGVTCSVFYGGAAAVAPAVLEGVVKCQ
jgi:prepilin-type N-terminal cleavage/methylation domain-containing protein